MTVSYTRAIELLEKEAQPAREMSAELSEAYAMAIGALRRERLNGIGGFPLPTEETLAFWRRLGKQIERGKEQ